MHLLLLKDSSIKDSSIKDSSIKDSSTLLKDSSTLLKDSSTMLSSLKPRTLVIRESKISYKSSVIHPLARFVTEEAVCLKFNIKFEDIYIVECWRYVVYVHAKGISRFVSYADFPPVIGVKPPTASEMAKWRRRWLKQQDFASRKQAPKWWAQFFVNQFNKATWENFLYDWGKLIKLIKFAFNEEILQKLRESYRQNKELLVVNNYSPC